MRVAILENLLRINTVLLFAVGFIAGYQQTMFGREWIEDHAKSEGFVRQGRLSTTAIFSKSLSDRRRVLMWASAFLALMAVQAGILWLRSL
jgi:hypothetical protein